MTNKQVFIYWDDEEPAQPYPSDLINLLKDEAINIEQAEGRANRNTEESIKE